MAEAFDCVICLRHVDNRWPGARQTQALKPICRYCEQKWSARAPTVGAFRDRRVASQISALANALETEANHQQFWRSYAS